MGALMPPKEYRSWCDDFEKVLKWTSITVGGLVLVPSVLLMSCCCLGLVLEPTLNRFKWGDCEVQRDQDYPCSKGVYLICNEEGLILNRQFQWMERNRLWKEPKVWIVDFSRLDCLPDQDTFHVLDEECTEVIFRYEGKYKVIEDCGG